MKRYAATILTVIGLPLSSMANNSIAKSTGISDGILLALMLSFILLLLAIVKALAKSIEGISKSPQLKKKNKGSNQTRVVSGIILMGLSFSANAAETVPSVPEFTMSNTLFWILLGFILFLAVVIGVLFNSLLTLIKLERGEDFAEEEETVDLFKSLHLTDNVPIEEEINVMMDHEYDGIKELDNNLPPWWKYMFYATIVFSFIYIIRFHITGNGKLQGDEYAAEMKEAEEAKAVLMANSAESITEENVLFLADAAAISKGEAIYKGNCATCHGQLGEGGAGPNLTDEYWLHGGGIKNVFKTIKYGVPAKGMIAWQSQFSPAQMQKVASYILTLKGTNPPNGKAPQGEIYVEEVETIEESSDADSTNTENIEAVEL